MHKVPETRAESVAALPIYPSPWSCAVAHHVLVVA